MPVFSARNTDNPTPFRPALHYLLSRGSSAGTGARSASDLEAGRPSPDASMASQNQPELLPRSLPLISILGTPSPHILKTSTFNAGSDTEDDDLDDLDPRGAFFSHHQRPTGWRGFLKEGGLGIYLFATTRGWGVYVGFMCWWLMATGIGLMVINWLVLLTGVYKFPYPLTATLIELLGCHLLLWAFASFTRLTSHYLTNAGLAAVIAPSYAPPKSSISTYTNRASSSLLRRFLSKILRKTGSGIAGGGLLEFDRAVVRKTALVSLTYVLKAHLSNTSYAHTELPLYVLARIGVVPLTALFGSLLNGTTLSLPLLSATLSATLNLLVASARANIHVTWDSVLAGVASSIFAALFTVLLQSTHRNLSSPSPERARDLSGSRTIYALLHHVSLLAILFSLPLVLLSGEPADIARNCHFLDDWWLWFMMFCGSLGTFCVFTATALLVQATSPLTVSFLSIPRYAFLIPVLAKFSLPMYSWVGIVLAFASSAWFVRVRRRESKKMRI